MNTEPFVIDRTLNAPVERVWRAITEKEQMKTWYFDLADFQAVEGFSFEFYGGAEDRQYLHLCKVTEVIDRKKLSYSWTYEGYPGYSVVSFELFPEGDSTRLRLTHAGLETFPSDNKDFAKSNFEAGWTEIIGTSLKTYVEE